MLHARSAYRIIVAFGLGLLATGSGHAQSAVPATKVDVEHVGPGVGDRLPDFTLRDQYGKVRSLRSLVGPKGGVIVFFRSADW